MEAQPFPTVIACQCLNYMLRIRSGLYLACHIVFQSLALTIAVIRLWRSQILYKNICLLRKKKVRQITFVLVLLRHIVRGCCCFFHSTDVSRFIFGAVLHSWCSSSEQCSVCCFTSPVPLCSIKWCLKETLMFSSLLWVKCKRIHWHGPGDRRSWQLARHFQAMLLLCGLGKIKFGDASSLTAFYIYSGCSQRIRRCSLISQTAIWLSI